MHMVIDEGRYYHSVSSWIGDEESVVIEASDGLVMPSFAGVYSCHQFFRRVAIVALLPRGKGEKAIFPALGRGRMNGGFFNWLGWGGAVCKWVALVSFTWVS